MIKIHLVENGDTISTFLIAGIPNINDMIRPPNREHFLRVVGLMWDYKEVAKPVIWISVAK